MSRRPNANVSSGWAPFEQPAICVSHCTDHSPFGFLTRSSPTDRPPHAYTAIQSVPAGARTRTGVTPLTVAPSVGVTYSSVEGGPEVVTTSCGCRTRLARHEAHSVRRAPLEGEPVGAVARHPRGHIPFHPGIATSRPLSSRGPLTAAGRRAHVRGFLGHLAGPVDGGPVRRSVRDVKRSFARVTGRPGRRRRSERTPASPVVNPL